MKDIPGKDKQQCVSNISVAGIVVQGAAAGEQGEGAGGGGDQPVGNEVGEGGLNGHRDLQDQSVHQRVGVCAAKQDGHGQGHTDEQAVHGEAIGGPLQHGGGGAHGRQDERRDGVLTQVKDGFGGQKVKRSYWRKRLVPDGLVQSRINHFSAIVPKLGVGGGGNGVVQTSASSVGCTAGRKRKIVDQETWAAK